MKRKPILTLAISVLTALLLGSTAHAAVSYYWDVNSSANGSGGPTPNGTWNAAGVWTSVATGNSTTTSWTSGDTAIFSAGTDATGAYTVTLSGSTSVDSIYVEEGTVTIDGTGQQLTLNGVSSIVDVVSGSSLTFSNKLSGGFTKTGSGTVYIYNTNTFNSGSSFNAGLTVIASSAAFGDSQSGTINFNGGNLKSLASGNNLFIGPNHSIVLSGASTTFDINTSGAFLSYSGAISGSGGLTKSGAGTLVLGGSSTYNGGTTVSSGGLKVTNGSGSATGTGAVAVSAGAKLGGNGKITGDLTLDGYISPGSSPGTIYTGNETWNGGATYYWEINDAQGTEGSMPGWDVIDISGTLTINATPANRFIVDLNTLTSSGSGPGNAQNFSASSDYVWRIVRTSSGISGFDVSKFLINYPNFSNSTTGGTFSLELSGDGNDLLLRYTSGAPKIVTEPVGANRAQYGAFFTSVNVSGAPGMAYQWRKDGVNIATATSSSFMLFSLSLSDDADYDVVVTNNYGSVTSSLIHLTVKGNACKPGGLVHWWPLDNDTYDYGTDADGVMLYGAQFDQGKNGDALFLDGNDDRMTTTVNAPVGEYTLECWVKFTGGSYSRGSYNTIVEFGNDSPWFGVDNNGALNMYPHISGGSMPVGQWTHVAYTWDGTNSTLYIDGSGVATNTVAPTTSGTGMGFGAFSGDTPWLGLIDEVAIYNRALSSSEIQSIAACADNSCAPPAAGIVSWWRAEGAGNDTITNNTAYLQGAASYSASKVGMGFALYAGDYVIVSNTAALMPATISVEAWVNPFSLRPSGSDIVISHGSSTGNNETFSLGFFYGKPTFITYHSTIGAHVLQAEGTVSPNNWYHLAATFDGTTKRLYLNGVEVASASMAYPLGYDASVPWTIGDDIDGGFTAGTYLTGLIDEVAIYNTALTAAEIDEIYSADSTGKCLPPSAPTIAVQPYNQTNSVGGVAFFGVAATGSSPLYYQWKRDGVLLEDGATVYGANSANLILMNITVGDAGLYSVEVTNAYGSITSSNAALVVLEPPVITQYPASLTNAIGTSATFTVAASSELPISYQWHKDGTTLSDNTKYSGATSSTLTVNSLQIGDSANYWVEVSNADGSAFASAYLTVVTAPVIVIAPKATTNAATTVASLNVVATGGALKYQWRRGPTTTTQTNISDNGTLYGTTTSSLMINNVLASEAGFYSVVVSNPVGTNTTTPVKLTVIDPVIFTQPSSQGRLLGGTATFSVVAAGTSPLTYQWKKGTINVVNAGRISGATSSSLTITNVTTNDFGDYKVTVSNSKGSATSSAATLGLAVAPTIVNPVLNLIRPPGGTATFSATVTGTQPLTYQWRKNGSNLSANSNFIGVNTTSLTVSPVNYGDDGTYTLFASNDAGNAVSGGMTLLVSNVMPTITITSPTNNSTFAAPATITITANASDPDGYIKWVDFYANGNPVKTISNATASASNTVFSFSGTNLPAGNYNVMAFAYDSSGAVAISSNIFVTVTSDCVLPPSGIISWWRGEGNANDFFGINNGTLYGSATANGVGQIGSAFTFDGVNGVVSVPDSSTLNAASGSQLTVELWAYRIGSSSSMNLIGKRSECGPVGGNYQLSLTSDFGLTFGNGASDQAASGKDLPMNQWVHLAGTYDGSMFKLYMNGQLIGAATGNLGPMNSSPLIIGGSGNCSRFSGFLDEVALYNRALSAQEIQSIYFAGAVGKCTSPMKLASANMLSGLSDLRATGVSISDGAAYVSGVNGTNNDDGMIARFTLPTQNTNAPSWSTNWPGQTNGDHFNAVIAVPGDGVYVAGDSYSRTLDTAGLKDPKGMIVKFPFVGPTGNGFGGSVWDKQTPANSAYGYGGAEVLNAVTAAKEGTNVYIYTTGQGQAGRDNNGRLFVTKMKTDSTVLWTATDSSSVSSALSSGRGVTALNGYVYVAGRNDDFGYSAGVLRKYDPQGALVWSQGRQPGEFNGVTAFGGAIYAVGTTASSQFLLEKYNEAGSLLWTRDYSINPTDNVLSSIIGFGTRLYAVGYTRNNTSEKKEAVILEISPEDGTVISQTFYTGPSHTVATSVATDGSDLYVAGSTVVGAKTNAILLRYQVSQPVVPLVIISTNLSVGELNKTYRSFLQAVGGKPPYTWAVATGNLPGGLSLTTNGIIQGTPIETGDFNFTVAAIDSTTPPQTATRSFSLHVITSNDLPVVTILAPSNGSSFTEPASFSLYAEASDNDGIDHVEFYENGALIGTGTGEPYGVVRSDLRVGSYVYYAVAYDIYGASTTSASMSVRVNQTGTTVIDFEALDTSAGRVTGFAVEDYLADFGVFVTNETAAANFSVDSQSNILGGSAVNASSGRNVFSQTDVNGKTSYRLGFRQEVASLGFTRVKLLAGVRGISHPAWRVTAYDATGTELASVGEDQISSFTNVPAQDFKLYGPNIASIRVEADNHNLTKFSSLVLDDLMLSTLLGNTPPSVSIITPREGTRFTAPADVTVEASASDSDGSISQIRFYLGSTLVGSAIGDTSATTTLSRLAPGNYTIRAVAEDNGGAVRSSLPVTFTVDPAPGITVINFDALDASSKNVGGTTLSNYLSEYGVRISASTVGGRVEAADTKNLAGGNAVVPASPNNVLTEVGQSGPIFFTLRFTSTQQSVQFTRAALNSADATVSHPAWRARAFNLAGVELATAGESLIVSRTNVPSKQFKIVASDIAWVRFESDAQGIAMFPAVLIDDLILNSNAAISPLSVSLTSPANNSVYTAPVNITVSAAAGNANGSIDHVEFYAGPNLIGSDFTAPYSITWSNVLSGSYTLKSRVVDTSGMAQWSGPVSVTVNPGAAGDASIINFDSLNAAATSVSGAPLTSYFTNYGVTLSDTTAGTTLIVQNQANILGGSVVEASSSPNVFTQTGPYDSMGFTMQFGQPLQSFQFTRPKLKTRASGITHPAWTAYAYDAAGTLVDSTGEDLIVSYTDVDSQVFVLQGVGITKVRFESSNRRYAAFNAVLLDDMILTKMSSNLPPIVTITTPTSDNVFLAPATITVAADATDLDGSVSQVEFYNGGSRIGIVSAAPYSITLSNLAVGRYTLTAIAQDNAGARRTSVPVRIKVEPPPTVFGILSQPEDQEVATGDTATFTVLTTEIGTPTYQWRFNGVKITGATSSTLVLSNVLSTNAGSYSVVVSNGVTSVTSETATLTVLDAPVITEQPEGQSAEVGDNVYFSVQAIGAAPLTYQWLLNGQKIDGATSSQLVLTELQVTDAGNYSVVVANRIGAVKSQRANLIVNFSGDSTSADNFADRVEITPLFGPTVGNNTAATLEDGEPVHANKTGGKSIWYTWHATFDGVMSLTTLGSSFDTLMAVYTGTELKDLTLVAADDDSGGRFASKVVFNCVEGVDYQIAIDGYYGASGSVILSMPANGYRVLDVTGNDEQIPIITVEPQSRSVVEGANVTLTVEAQSSAPLTYQWSFDGTPVIDATNSSFSITGFDSSFVGHYSVLVANEFGSVESQTANLQLIDVNLENPDDISSRDKFAEARTVGVSTSNFRRPKGSQTGNAGSTRGFTTTQVFSTVGSTKEEGEPNHAGEPGGASEWFAYTSPTNGMMVRITTEANFNTVLAVYTGNGVDFDSLQEVDSDNSSSSSTGGDSVYFLAQNGVTYYIAVDGVGGASGTVTLKINQGDPPTITAAPQSKYVAPGGAATFNVSVSGSTNFGYQWKFNGVSIAGATQSSYTRSGATVDHTGGYTVVVSNLVNVITNSPSATLTVVTPPSITTQPASKTVTAGTSTTLTVSASGGGTLAYQWRYNGSAVSGATKSSLTYSSIQTTNAGSYTVVITNVTGAITSSVAALTVDVPYPKAVTPAQNAVISSTPVTVTGTIAATARITQIKYQVNGGAFSNATGTTSWSFTANLTAGTNVIGLKAIDASGHESVVTNRTLFYLSTTLFSLSKTGVGDIASTVSIFGTPTNNAMLAIGKPYKVTASVGKGTNDSIFTNWTVGGEIVGTNAAYTFTMSNGLHVVANFIDNPFLPASGTYNGLFYETNELRKASAGYITLRLTPRLAYSGKLYLDGDTLGISGTFNTPGTVEKVVSRSKQGKSTVTVQLRVNFGADTVTGTITNSDLADPWISEIHLDRWVWTTNNMATLYTNKYTMAIPGFSNDADGPPGWGYGLLSVDTLGRVKLSGLSADNQKIQLGVPVSKYGTFPFYKSMYLVPQPLPTKTNKTYNGLMMGWVTITNNTPAGKTNYAPRGNITWIKSSWTNGYYDVGFTNTTMALGSRVLPFVKGTRAIAVTNGSFVLGGGNLTTFTNSVFLTTNNVLQVTGTNTVVASIAAINGLVKGTFVHPAKPTPRTAFFGVSLADYNYARGFFMGTNTAGFLKVDQ